MHRDLNLNNVLIRKGKPVLIDFTFACLSDGRHKFSDFYGTPPFAAPELIEGAPYYPHPAEVYSLGIILSQLDDSEESKELIQCMTHNNPYKRATIQQILAHPYFN